MISVIIPLYNKANCIKRTIQSVLSQSYKDFELLIVDDGSTDESKNIVLSITDSRIRYIYKENGGVSSARNYGAQKANSKWLFFLDADDVLLPNALHSLVSNCNEHCQIISGGFVVQNENSKINKIPRVKGLIKNPLRQWWLKNIMPRTGNLLLTKELFFSLGGFDERVSYNEDYGFLLKMLSTYEIFIVKDLIMVYTDDNKSLSTRRTPLESEFGNYMCSLSIDNIYRRVLIYQQYIFTYKRRLAIGDKDGAIKVKNELNLRFSLLMKYTAWIMSKFSSVYNKKICLY